MYSFLKFILPFIFCAQTAFSGNVKPNWVKERPLNADFYIGIGSASKTLYPQKYRQVAKDEALQDLASEIKVKISGEIIHRIAEQGGMLEDEIRSLVKSKTQANLEDYELVDSWESSKEYWVYYRLSKQKYQKHKTARRNKVSRLAGDFFRKAQKSEKAKNLTSAIRYALQALAMLDEFLGEPLQVNHNGQKVYLQNELYSLIHSSLNCLKLKPDKPMIKAKKGFGLPHPLRVHVSCTKEGKNYPVADVPLEFSFVKGSGQLISKVLSNSAGIASCPVSRITSADQTQIIQVKVNMAELLKGKKAPIKYLTVPETRFILRISSLSAYIESTEENMGEKLKVLLLQPKLKKALSAKGFSFTGDVSEADYMIKIEARTREALGMLGTSMVKADISISVTSLRSGEEVYENGFTTFPGVGFKSGQAGIVSLEFAARKMDDIAEEIVKKTVK